MHTQAVESEEVGIASRDRAAEQNDPPHYVRDMPGRSREPASSRAIELVEGLEQLGFDYRFAEVRRVHGRDRRVELVQRLPALAWHFAVALRRPFSLDHDIHIVAPD